MQTIYLYFQIHQPFRLRNIPFFEIGNGMDYFDEELNRTILREEALDSYLPLNRLLLKLIQENKRRFTISFCISGTALEQFEKYMPELIDSFQELSATGCVEFIGETYSHSLAGLLSREEFARQAEAHSAKIKEVFGVKPKAFQISGMGYTDALGQILRDLGFETVLLEETGKPGEDSLITRIYRSAILPDLKVIINTQQADSIDRILPDLTLQERPLPVESYFDLSEPAFGDVQWRTIRLDYGLFKIQKQNGRANIEYLNRFVEKSLSAAIQFKTPSYINQWESESPSFAPAKYFPSGKNSPKEISGKLGNEMQQEAFYTLYELEYLILSCPDSGIKRDWLYLQSSDHFYYMCTAQISPSVQAPDLSPYESSFFAFINFMNVLSDIRMRAETILEGRSISGQDIHKEKMESSMEAVDIQYTDVLTLVS